MTDEDLASFAIIGLLTVAVPRLGGLLMCITAVVSLARRSSS